MYTITVYGVSEAVRVAVLRETGTLPDVFHVSIGKDHALWNDAVDLFGTKLQQSLGINDHIFTEVPTPENVIAILKRKAAEQLEKDAKNKASYEAMVETALAAPTMDLLRDYQNSERPATEDVFWTIGIKGFEFFDGRIHHVVDDERLAPRIAELRELINTQKNRLEAAAQAAKQAKEDAIQSEMAAWITEHGSNRLKRSLAEGIKCHSLYLEERIEKELPGWTYHSDTPGKTTNPINATEDDFAMLDEARAMLPESVLKWYSGEDGKGMVVEGKFLGQQVIYGHDSIESEDSEEYDE